MKLLNFFKKNIILSDKKNENYTQKKETISFTKWQKVRNLLFIVLLFIGFLYVFMTIVIYVIIDYRDNISKYTIFSNY